MQLSLAEIAVILHAEPPAAASWAAGAAIDSRQLRPGELFFALRGEHSDGHQHVLAALGAGACAAVVAREELPRFAPAFRPRLIAVDHPETALGQLAAAVRRRWGKKVVGITGSAGKTTSKELIARVLATRYQVLKTEGNFNNHLGVPLTLLRLTPAHEIAVIEMGMNHAGEIAALARLAQPQVGVFTVVAPVHLGFFPSLDAIAAAKRELLEALPGQGIAVLNANDPRVARFGDGWSGRKIYYGLSDDPAHERAPQDWGVRIENIISQAEAGSEFTAVAGGQREIMHLPLLGRHNVANAAAALATGQIFGVDLRLAARALAGMRPGPGRGRVLRLGSVTVLDDCYNANPEAVERMLQVLRQMPGRRHLAVLGEMRELGAASRDWHFKIGQLCARMKLDAIFAVAGDAGILLEGARAAGYDGPCEFFPDAQACIPAVRAAMRPGDVILVKGSHGVHLEILIADLEKDESPNAGLARSGPV